VALFWGEDQFLVRDAARAHLQAFDVRATEVDGRAWQGGETSDLATPSLWGERRGLLVLDAAGLPEAGVREVETYLSAPPPDVVLVLTVVSRGARPPRLAGAVDAAGGTVRQVALRKQDVGRWLQERAKARNLRLTPPGASALQATLGDDPATLHQAVEQLAAAFGDESVGPDLVQAQFQGVGEQRVWDLCDQALGGRLPEAMVALRSLLEDREDALVILGGIASRIRDLLRVSELPARLPAAEAAKAVGLRFDWQIRRYREQAGRFAPGALADLHGLVVDADRALKGGVPGNVLLPTLVAAMAGRPEAALKVEIRSSR
jgi:DNA polymerase III subunit delta